VRSTDYRAPDGGDYRYIVSELNKNKLRTIAAVIIPPFSILRINIDEKAILADSNISGSVIGISTNKEKLNIGDEVEIQLNGKIKIGESLIPGSDYYLNGTLSLIPPTSGYVIKLGQAVTQEIFNIRIEQGIKL